LSHVKTSFSWVF